MTFWWLMRQDVWRLQALTLERQWPATGHPPGSLEQLSHPDGALLGRLQGPAHRDAGGASTQLDTDVGRRRNRRRRQRDWNERGSLQCRERATSLTSPLVHDQRPISRFVTERRVPNQMCFDLGFLGTSAQFLLVDSAVVIFLAAPNLPTHHQTKAVP